MKAISSLALCLCVFTGIFSGLAEAKTQKVKQTNLPNGLVVHEYKLDNGMQLLLVPDHTAPVVTYEVWFRVGSATEKLDPRLNKTGLAHLFEHMMFRGTPKNPDGVFADKVSAAGSPDMNATTWLDRTNYFESLPKEKLELAFQLESDRMANLAIDEKLFKTELGAVMGELKMGKDKPMGVADDEMWDLTFEKHPYKWTTIGTPEELNSFKVEDALYFYKTYYAPNNAAIILLGDFQIPQAIALAEKYYGKMKPQTIPAHESPVEPVQTKARTRSVTHPLANNDIVMMGYQLPDIRHPDMAALDVAASIMAYGNGSWLEQELTQEGIVSSVSASPRKNKLGGLFYFAVQMAPGKGPNDALKVIKDAVNRLHNGKVTEAELTRAKNQFLLYSYQDLLNLSSIGRTLGESWASADDYLRDFEILEQVKKVTVAEVQRVAKTYIVDEKSNLVTMSPEKGK